MATTGQSSITVAVRVRPFTIREAAQLQKTDDSTIFLGDGSLAGLPTPKLHQRGLRSVIKVVDDRCLVFDPPEDNPVQRFSRSVIPTSRKVKDQVFAFDRVFDDNTTQTDVYEGTTKSLLDSVLDGYNATVFAYGATGCGKTHTITGTADHPGIIFLTMQELFEKIDDRSQEKTTELSLSYLEIYNETIRDLLVPGGSKSGLMLREDSNHAVTVSGLSSHHPRDVQEVMDMIVQGNEYRTVSPTEANATSSRSHAVLQVNIAQKDRNADVSEPHTMATLSIIDLAGSERASVTKNRGERLTEGANINKSLLALGSCINALCDRRLKTHVPYRNSKLTRLLKFSLGGNCKTVMIVCVSPSSAHFDETQNTLRYANRAKNIQTKVTRNVFNVNRHVKDFLVKIDEQMALINELKAQQKDAEKVHFAKFRKQCDRREAVVREGIQRLRTAYDNAAADRRERIASMKKLRAIERRIGLLSAWIAAFEAVCDRRGDDAAAAMPPTLTAIRKTAQGILVELENSRQHMHQRLEAPTWERAVDTALTHSLKQLEAADGADAAETATLDREAELLKANFNREAYRDVLEQEKAGEASTMQLLLTAQLDMLSTLADTLSMDEASAVARAKGIIHSLLQTGYQAATQMVKPDGSSAVVDMFPPTRKGTPKRKKSAPSSSHVRSNSQPLIGTLVDEEQALASPARSSPRRRKVLGPAKKGVCFSPTRKSKGRGVRWRDDESEDGTLADFARTPQKFEGSSPAKEPPSPGRTVESAAEAAPPNADDATAAKGEASPPVEVREAASVVGHPKPSRFQTGFLSKGTRSASQQGGSPLPTPPTLSLNLSPSGTEDETETSASPLRTLDAGKASNASPPSRGGLPRSRPSPRVTLPTADENTPLQATTETGSDSECGVIDLRKLRTAMQSVKKDKARRASILTGTVSANAKRVSSFGPVGDRPSRPSMPASLASNANGVSRHRRGSLERRKSPPLTCSPTEFRTDRSFTAGQARRMNVGGSVRMERPTDGGGSPSESRRVTYSVASLSGHRRQGSKGTWR
ncbi:hypothetical protein RJ55_01698 [Drechmeria coniospora]|nr:hypothetical protein RJ55_01698 [Drechmeria coniospora]